MAVNKVVFGAVSVIDISDSTVTADTLAKGATAYDKSGEKIVGKMESGSAEVANVKISRGSGLGNTNLGKAVTSKASYSLTTALTDIECKVGDMIVFISSKAFISAEVGAELIYTQSISGTVVYCFEITEADAAINLLSTLIG